MTLSEFSAELSRIVVLLNQDGPAAIPITAYREVIMTADEISGFVASAAGNMPDGEKLLFWARHLKNRCDALSDVEPFATRLDQAIAALEKLSKEKMS
jgi:hypothetical protein